MKINYKIKPKEEINLGLYSKVRHINTELYTHSNFSINLVKSVFGDLFYKRYQELNNKKYKINGLQNKLQNKREIKFTKTKRGASKPIKGV